MEIIAAIVAALLGWRNAAFGRNELTVLAIVVLGWTAVTTLATIPYVTVGEIVLQVVFRTLLIAVPYTVAALAKRWTSKRRR